MNMRKGEMGIREVVILIIFIAVLLVSLAIILAIKGQLGNFVDKLGVSSFREWFN